MTNDAYQRGYADGYRDALAQLMSPATVAKELGTTNRRLLDYAQEINAGILIDNTIRLYTPSDLERLRIRKNTDLRIWRKEHGH
jgi:hypothetical protein